MMCLSKDFPAIQYTIFLDKRVVHSSISKLIVRLHEVIYNLEILVTYRYGTRNKTCARFEKNADYAGKNAEVFLRELRKVALFALHL